MAAGTSGGGAVQGELEPQRRCHCRDSAEVGGGETPWLLPLTFQSPPVHSTAELSYKAVSKRAWIVVPCDLDQSKEEQEMDLRANWQRTSAASHWHSLKLHLMFKHTSVKCVGCVIKWDMLHIKPLVRAWHMILIIIITIFCSKTFSLHPSLFCHPLSCCYVES